MSVQISVSEITLKFDRIEKVSLSQLVILSFRHQNDDSEIRINLANSLMSNNLTITFNRLKLTITKVEIRIDFTVCLFLPCICFGRYFRVAYGGKSAR